MKTLSIKLKEAEQRAEHAEKQVKRLQKEVDRLEGMYPGHYHHPSPLEVASLQQQTSEMVSPGCGPTRVGSLASTNARIVYIARRILIFCT